MSDSSIEDKLKRNIIWFALGMIVMCVVGTVAALGWLQSFVDGRIAHAAQIDASPLSKKGAVIAFQFAPSDKPKCPEDWSRFSDAGGRVIIGAGPHSNKDERGNELTTYKQGDNGGEEKHKLTIEEMPSHQHAVYQHAGWQSKNAVTAGAGGDDTGTKVHAGISGVAGGEVPHNNLPPYIALYYCKKD